MSVIISGSIAYDTVFTHEGRFADTLRAEALDRLNVTLQADSMRRTYGGCAANIAYSLSSLAEIPLSGPPSAGMRTTISGILNVRAFARTA